MSNPAETYESYMVQPLFAPAARGLLIREDMEGPLRDLTEGNHVVIPFHALIARAYRER